MSDNPLPEDADYNIDTRNLDSERDDDPTLSLGDLRRRRRVGEQNLEDMIQKTTVISRDNPILKRALNNQASADGNADASLGAKREVVLVVRGMVERLMIEEGIIYKLGRFDLGGKADNEIDLTPYGAMDRGVSRIHAEMHAEDNTLFIRDLGSTNGTYLGGKKLEPDVPTEIRKGDELLLGRLAMQVMFR